MKINKFEKKDGTTSEQGKPETGDTIVALASSVYKSEPRAVIVDKGTDKARAVNITTRGIKASFEGKELFVVLTEGQAKVLDKTEDLMNKTIVFEEYDSKKYGKLVGARVQK